MEESKRLMFLQVEILQMKVILNQLKNQMDHFLTLFYF